MDLDRIVGCRSHLRGMGDFTIPGAEPHYPPDLEIEPTHIDIALRFDIPQRTAQGAVTTTVEARRAGARKLVLNAQGFQDLAVADEAGHALAFAYDGKEIAILWDRPFAHGEARKLRVSYRVSHPASGLIFSAPDEGYPDRDAWAATDHETERARYWLPCVDFPAVRTTLAFHLTSLSGHVILANGVIEREEVHGDGTKTAHWRLDFPCPSYLVCLAVGDFVSAEDEAVDGRPIAYFAARGRATAEDLKRSFGRTPAIMRWLEKKLGVPFPFPKYYQFALPAFGGAMENISLVSWDDIAVMDETWERDLGQVIDMVNLHEMAHSYFGDAVVIRDFAHTWLKESWATYLEPCWFEDVLGEDEARYRRFTQGRGYMEEADKKYMRPIVTRVFNSSWDIYDEHSYPGGAWRLHMLRRLLGDDVFWPAVTDYLKTYLRRTVETEEFRRKLEEHSGRSLVKFFDQWVYGKGYPKLRITFARDPEKKEGTFTVEQAQGSPAPEGAKGKGKPTEGPPKDGATLFTFPLTLAWEGPDGAWRKHTVEVERAFQSFGFAMERPPRQIRIDPDDALLHRLECNPGDEMLLRALRHAPDVVGRILAAEELSKTGKRANLEAIGRAFAREPFWGVRREMAKAVGESRHAAAVAVLSGMMEAEPDPRVLAIVAGQAGRFRDQRIARALEALLDRGPTYRVAAAALRSLGAQRAAAHLPRLETAAADTGYRGLVRAGAIYGLAEARSGEAFDLLRRKIGYGNEIDDTAADAVGAYADIARFLEKRLSRQAVEDLIEVLRDPREKVRLAAARGLSALRAGEALPALEALLPTLAEQYQPRVRRMMLAIQRGPEGATEAAALREELEKLEEKHRKLEERLDKLEAAPRPPKAKAAARSPRRPKKAAGTRARSPERPGRGPTRRG